MSIVKRTDMARYQGWAKWRVEDAEQQERQVSSERALRRELERMTPREVEKFRDWCDRNAVPVVLV